MQKAMTKIHATSTAPAPTEVPEEHKYPGDQPDTIVE